MFERNLDTNATPSFALILDGTSSLSLALARELLSRGQRVKVMVSPKANLSELWPLINGDFSANFSVVQGYPELEDSVYRALAGCEQLVMSTAFAEAEGLSRAPRAELSRYAVARARACCNAAQKRNLKRILYLSPAGALGAAQEPNQLHLPALADIATLEPARSTWLAAQQAGLQVSFEYQQLGAPLTYLFHGSTFGEGLSQTHPNGQLLTHFLCQYSPKLELFEGGVSVVELHALAEALANALAHPDPGPAYLLGGENLSYQQLYQHLAELSGLSAPAQISESPFDWRARFESWRALLTPKPPSISLALACELAPGYVWLDSTLAERELHFSSRPARHILRDTVLWYLKQRYLPPKRAARLSPELFNETY